MAISELKEILIERIKGIDDEKILEAIKAITELQVRANGGNKDNNEAKNKRKFGCGKGIVTFMSDDFDEPLDAFKEYVKGDG